MNPRWVGTEGQLFRFDIIFVKFRLTEKMNYGSLARDEPGFISLR